MDFNIRYEGNSLIMETNFKPQDGNLSDQETDEQSSTTGDSSGLYAYYPSIDFPYSTRKFKSRLGKRRHTINPFRISTDVVEPQNEKNSSGNNSREDSSSLSISRDLNLMEKQQTKPAEFEDSLYTPVVRVEQKFSNLYLSGNNQPWSQSKEPLKQTSTNIFRGNTTTLNSQPPHQPSQGKNVFGSISLNCPNSKSNQMSKPVKNEPETQRARLNIDLDARNFINIFDMPSVKLAETPPRFKPSLSLPQLRNPKAGNPFFDSAPPAAKDLSINTSPQETAPKDMDSVLDLSMDNRAKGANLNQLNTTVNTASFKPSCNSSVIGEIDHEGNKENERMASKLPVSRAPLDSKLLAKEIFKMPSMEITPMKAPVSNSFKKPAQPLTTNANSSGIPSFVSQPQIINPNFVLPKLNPRPQSKPYSFSSDVAKFRQKEGGPKVTIQNAPQPSNPSSTPCIKVNNRSYNIHSTIGKGGSSEVYKVEDPGSKSFLAMKVVKLASVDEAIAEGYMNEVKLLEKLQGCSSVIRMFDYEYIQETKKLYVVMELGETDLSRLLKDIKKTKEISPIRILYYWTEMLTAVQEIHEKGIIHSDLKPANFLFVSGRLKLIDFGIASSLQGDMTSVHKDICAGTENYMSPEAIKDGTGGNDKKYKISYKSDVWSLGCILYNLIYGKTPFSHITSHWGKMYAIISSSHKIDFPNHPIPPILRQAMQRCLIRDPKQRPTVKDLLDGASGFLFQSPCVYSCKDLPLKIQQSLPQECWLKIAHLFQNQ
nr:PREDICTED: dual specificity protein kinase Ttk-like [Bemisia tabaci]